MSSDLLTDDDALASPPSRPDGQRELTGRTVLGLILAFFAVVFGVNAFMAHEALSTFGGVDTESAYQAGRLFEREVAKSKAQDAKHWRVEASVKPAAQGGAGLDIVVRDEGGAVVRGLGATVVFERPTDRRLDRTAQVSEVGPGHFVAVADVAAGQWEVVLELSRNGERQFRSKNRVVLR